MVSDGDDLTFFAYTVNSPFYYNQPAEKRAAEAVDKVSTASETKMGTSENVPIFAWIVREGGLSVPLH